MSDQVKIPRATLKRLPLYYRFVSSLKSKGIDRVNSKAISDALQIDSATIRRDFSYFGELGKKGYGYKKIGNVIVKDNDELVTTLKKEEIDVVILTTPERVAQKVADELVQAGVKGILNFTPGRIKTPSDVQVHQIDLGIELQSLLFFMKNYSE